MNAPCLGAEGQRRKKRVQMLRHQDTAQRLEDHEGKKQCVDLINSFGNKPLNEYTDEEDFILGVLLGYDKIAECERYMSRKNHSTYSAAGKVKMKEAK